MEQNYKDKYLKYKNKYNLLKIKIGGMIENNDILTKIKSIGFEFETNKMSPFIIEDNNLKSLGRHKKYLIENYENYIFLVHGDAPGDIYKSPVYLINNIIERGNVNEFLWENESSKLIRINTSVCIDGSFLLAISNWQRNIASRQSNSS
jgi:hypothetical protein